MISKGARKLALLCGCSSVVEPFVANKLSAVRIRSPAPLSLTTPKLPLNDAHYEGYSSVEYHL